MSVCARAREKPTLDLLRSFETSRAEAKKMQELTTYDRLTPLLRTFHTSASWRSTKSHTASFRPRGLTRNGASILSVSTVVLLSEGCSKVGMSSFATNSRRRASRGLCGPLAEHKESHRLLQAPGPDPEWRINIISFDRCTFERRLFKSWDEFVRNQQPSSGFARARVR